MNYSKQYLSERNNKGTKELISEICKFIVGGIGFVVWALIIATL